MIQREPIGYFPKMILVIAMALILFRPNSGFANDGSISATYSHAWSETSGWMNAKSSLGEVEVYSTYLSGWIWSENIGWIKLGVDGGGPYENTSDADWGVNRDSDGQLSGYAWSETGGWINFSTDSSRVTIEADGWLSGYAWSENYGWIHFRNTDTPIYGVRVLFKGAPSAQGQTVAITMNTPVDLTLSGTDPDGDALTTTIVDAPAHGALTGTVPEVTYTPNTNYLGEDGFTFKVGDGQYESDAATVAITVKKDAGSIPTANDQRIIGSLNTAVAITLTGSDPDGDDLTYQVIENPRHGALTGTAPNLTYTPDSGYVGADAFSFRVNDGQSDSNLAVVDISVASRRLTVAVGGSGTGVVTSDPEGLNCSNTCSYDFPLENQVVLTAEPVSGSTFDGWSLSGCTGAGSCTIRMDQDYSLEAEFNIDSDGDGVSNTTENSGPNNGDANQDGAPDAQQNHVATFRSTAGEFITLTVESTFTLSRVRPLTNPSPNNTMANVSFPTGFLGFDISGVTDAAETVTVILTLHSKKTSVCCFIKYGPTPDESSVHWYDFTWNGTTGAVISQSADSTIITMMMQDGQRGDDDVLVNGVIIGIGGPASRRGGAGSGGGGGGCFLRALSDR